MRRVLQAGCAALALAGVLSFAAPAQACPMCKIALEDSPDPGAAARPRAYMYSILFMLSMPATLLTAFSISFYRLSKKQQALNAGMLDEYGLGEAPRDDFSA
jgi:hypothetical protein